MFELQTSHQINSSIRWDGLRERENVKEREYGCVEQYGWMVERIYLASVFRALSQRLCFFTPTHTRRAREFNLVVASQRQPHLSIESRPGGERYRFPCYRCRSLNLVANLINAPGKLFVIKMSSFTNHFSF